MEPIKKRLVFHFYLSPEGIYTYTNKIHFECLKRIGQVFDDAIFVITTDNTEDTNIKELMLLIVGFNISKNIEFSIRPNNYLRDSQTFYDEIVAKLGKYDGLTFFAHNKGTTNIQIEKPESKERIEKWITSLYYGNFYNIPEMEYALTEGRFLSYGTLMDSFNRERTRGCSFGKFQYFYTGTFFWINERSIVSYMERNNITVPILSDRWYAENFLSDIAPLDYCASPGMFRLCDFNIWAMNFNNAIDSWNQDFLEEYKKYHKEIIDCVNV